jgi:hypothetical protein
VAAHSAQVAAVQQQLAQAAESNRRLAATNADLEQHVAQVVGQLAQAAADNRALLQELRGLQQALGLQQTGEDVLMAPAKEEEAQKKQQAQRQGPPQQVAQQSQQPMQQRQQQQQQPSWRQLGTAPLLHHRQGAAAARPAGCTDPIMLSSSQPPLPSYHRSTHSMPDLDPFTEVMGMQGSPLHAARPAAQLLAFQQHPQQQQQQPPLQRLNSLGQLASSSLPVPMPRSSLALSHSAPAAPDLHSLRFEAEDLEDPFGLGLVGGQGEEQGEELLQQGWMPGLGGQQAQAPQQAQQQQQAQAGGQYSHSRHSSYTGVGISFSPLPDDIAFSEGADLAGW